MDMNSKYEADSDSAERLIFGDDAFSRADESDDSIFYSRDRFVQHLDSLALSTVETIIEKLIVEDRPVILDLMASWDSHIPQSVNPSKLIGLGLNENELSENYGLSEFIIHDLNNDPRLPFSDDYFDVVVNTVSVDYITKPVQLFKEVHRILKPGGLFLVTFSNRFFPPKVVKVWRESSEDERVILVEEFFRMAGGFEKTTVFVSKGRPRPVSDRYANLNVIYSDPIYTVYADKKGGDPKKVRPTLTACSGNILTEDELRERMQEIGNTLRCPYCSQAMRKWAVPQTPFTAWPNEFMYICFNDYCPYFMNGWDVMHNQGNRGVSYRLMYNPERDSCTPIPVRSQHALKESIVG
jgi:SAM-dependent methyltransferase